MRINLIENNSLNKCKQYSKQNRRQNTSPIQKTNLSKDKVTSSINFCGYTWVQKKLNILNRGEIGIKELGEYFHKTGEDEIKEASKITNFIGFEREGKSKLAFEKLSSAVEKVKEYKKVISDELSSLKIKESMGMENILDQKNRVTNQFIKFVKQEGQGESPPITNGILIYGDSKIKNDKFVEWFSSETPACFEKIEHNHKEPLKTLDKIIEKADDAEASFKITKKRTVLFVDKLDDIFTDDSTREGRNIIGRFKGIIENISAKSHTTILMKTTKPLEDFEDASIGGQRFGLKVAIKDGISKTESARIKEIKKELERLDDRASKVDSEFQEWNEPSSGDDGGGIPTWMDNPFCG